MDEATISRYLTETFAGVDTTVVDGDTFFFNNAGQESAPDHMFPFATIVTGDRYEQEVSDLDRPGVFRLNIGVGRDTFRSRFGASAAGRDDDYTALDTIMPHPEYGSMFWLCVLNPSDATFETLRPMLAEAYALAAERSRRRRPQAG